MSNAPEAFHSRNAPIGVRFLPDERAVLETAASMSGQTLSDFVRSTSLTVARELSRMKFRSTKMTSGLEHK